MPYSPYGPGSARATPEGGGPSGWLVKGRSDTRLYYTPDDPTYDATVAQVWFKDEESAARALFTPWRKSAKNSSGIASVSRDQAVDTALCGARRPPACAVKEQESDGLLRDLDSKNRFAIL